MVGAVAGDGAWREEVAREREWRERLYEGPGTPLSPEARAAFRGLAWYPVDARWRAPARLLRHAEPRAGRLAATGDEAVELLEVGVMELELLGRPLRLLAFEPAPGESDEPYVLVPFTDATSGRETYGAGRYLDLEPAPDDRHVLDFNRAYHPYCAHDDAWSCALPPPENRIPFAVEAGERLPPER